MILLAILAAANVTIPTAFTGDWAIERYGCASNDADAHLAIGHDTMSGPEESPVRIDQVTLLSPRRLELRYTLLFAEENVETTSIFDLSSDGRAMTEQTKDILTGETFVRSWVRCT